MRLWRDPAFTVFWSARTLSWLGTGITNLVLPVLVYQLTGSPAAVAFVNGIEAVPYLVLGLLAGALADRLNRRKIMVTCDAICAFLLAAVPAAAALHLLMTAQIFIVALGVATAFVWFDAANFGTLPALVDRAQLPAAVSLIGSTGTVAILAGPILGAAAIGVMAPSYALGLDAATYVMSALLLVSIRRPFRRPGQQPNRHNRIRADIAEGLRFLWNQPVIRTMTFAVCGACMTWGGTFGLLVVYASRALHMTHLGLLLLRTHLHHGHGTGITIRQMLTPDHLQSRVNTAGRMIAWGGQPVGALLGGLLASILPIRPVFALMTVFVTAGAGLAGWSCRRSGSLAAISVSLGTDSTPGDATG